MIIEKPVYAVALLAVALSLLCVLLVPGGDRFVAIAAVACGVATWVAPLLVLALSWNQKPRTSLAGVGFTRPRSDEASLAPDQSPSSTTMTAPIAA